MKSSPEKKIRRKNFFKNSGEKVFFSFLEFFPIVEKLFLKKKSSYQERGSFEKKSGGKFFFKIQEKKSFFLS